MAEPKGVGGRPLIYKTPEELQEAVDEYFDYCDNRIKTVHNKKTGELTINHPAPYTMSGLARAIGMDRRTLVDYQKRDGFLDTVKAAREKVHEDVEQRLMETSNQSGAIFNLKNNFGWKDQHDVVSDGEKLAGPVVYLPQRDE